MKRVISIILVVLLVTTGCVKNKEEKSDNMNNKKETEVINHIDDFKSSSKELDYKEVKDVTNFAEIKTNQGNMIIELYPDVAPITVANFQQLVSEKFYDGIIFHRVISGFMIQGGDPKGTGYGGSKNTIKGEFSSNGVENNLKHTRGVISMARSTMPDSASSQFFIMHADAPHLDGDYAAFGKVIAGYDVIDKIAAVQVDDNDKPLKEQKMESIRFIKLGD